MFELPMRTQCVRLRASTTGTRPGALGNAIERTALFPTAPLAILGGGAKNGPCSERTDSAHPSSEALPGAFAPSNLPAPVVADEQRSALCVTKGRGVFAHGGGRCPWISEQLPGFVVEVLVLVRTVDHELAEVAFGRAMAGERLAKPFARFARPRHKARRRYHATALGLADATLK